MSDRIEVGYTATARLFHWATAVLVLLMLPIGIVMANVDVGPATSYDDDLSELPIPNIYPDYRAAR